MNYNLSIKTNSNFQEIDALIEYEDIEKDLLQMKISEHCFLMRDEIQINTIKRSEEKVLNLMNPKLIASISKGKDCYKIKMNKYLDNPECKDELLDKPWMVIHKTFFKDSNGYKIKLGDCLKFGKIIFKVIEYKGSICEEEIEKNVTNHNWNVSHLHNSNYPLNDSTHTPVGMLIGRGSMINRGLSKIKKVDRISNNNILKMNNYPSNNSLEKDFPGRIASMAQSASCCRICLSEECTHEDPLISPCKCSGTMNYIHLSCMRSYFKSKITMQENNHVVIYCYQNFECDLCKLKIPRKILVNNKVHNLVELDVPKNNYMVLKYVTIRDTKKTYFLYVIDMKDKNSVKLGRAINVDVVISDISVSRSHAVLHEVNGCFFLSDNKSKFGTLVSIGHDFIVVPEKNLSIQTRKHLFSFEMRKKNWAKISCYRNKSFYFNDYSEYFMPNGFYFKETDKDYQQEPVVEDRTNELNNPPIFQQDLSVINNLSLSKDDSNYLDRKDFLMVNSLENDCNGKNKIPPRKKKFSAVNLNCKNINSPIQPKIPVVRSKFLSTQHINFNININVNDQNRLQKNNSLRGVKKLVDDLMSLQLKKEIVENNDCLQVEKEINPTNFRNQLNMLDDVEKNFSNDYEAEY